MYCRMFIALLLLMPISVLAVDSTVLDNNSGAISLLDNSPTYIAQALALKQLPLQAPDSPADFVNQLPQTDQIDRVNGGSYWLYHKFKNIGDVTQWVFDPYDSIIDTVHLYIYRNGEVLEITSGYLHDFRYDLSYASSFTIGPNEEVELLVFIQSRYFTDLPHLEIKPANLFLAQNNLEYIVVVFCLGAILILTFYNFFLGFLIKDKSYFFYSAYLLFTVISWLSAFNVFSQWLAWHSYWTLIAPFFITVTFNSLYVIYFLELRQHQVTITRCFYGLIAVNTLVLPVISVIPMGYVMLIYGLSSGCWVFLSLYSGLSRLREGYKPARFFVAAFAMLAVGILMSMIPIFIPDFDIKHNYLVTLVAQTVDMLLLSLALADRINLLRKDKELVLNNAIKLENWVVEKEQDANLQLQQALVRSEGESQRKSDFLRIVSHELRTPLYSIISSVEQWDNIAIHDEVKQEYLLSNMSHGAARLRMQVDNLVLLAETDALDVMANPSSFDVRSLFKRLCDNVANLVKDTVTFDYHCDDNVPRVLVGDAYLITNMLRTVLENACKYTVEGKVGLYAQWQQDTGQLSVQIIDTGCGMTREQERMMFNDFIQVSHGLDRHSEGLGIGLTVCYRLSEVLNAQLNIQSTLGEGTHVLFSIPLTPAAEQTSLSTNVELVNPQVLVVEDNVVNAKILEKLVQSMGGIVTLAYSGQEALEQLDNNSFDLVLMDIQMPVMDGITATRWLRRRNHIMPVVAVTANSDSLVRKHCIDVGMNDFLVKPIRRADLQHVFERQVFNGKQ